MKEIIIVGGPTATGKTEVALAIAKEFNGELINTDSRQIYRHLNIGTNKGNIKTLQNGECTINSIPIHLVNIINPDERFDLFRFQKLAFQKIEELHKKKKLPILVGGTGLYIDSIVRNYELGKMNDGYKSEEKSQQTEYRKHLETLSKTELQNIILKVQGLSLTLNTSDWNNPRRLIRFIEKMEQNNREKPEFVNSSNNISTIKKGSKFSSLFLYPEYNWDKLKERIDQRVREMFDEGLVEETIRVTKMGFKSTDPGLLVMGYKEVLRHINNEISLEKCIELVQIAHRQYARRQKTWFEGKGRNYELTKFKNTEEALHEVNQFLGK